MAFPIFTPPFYSTFTTGPAPLPNFSFSHGYTPPSPNPYTSASYSGPYGYQHQPYFGAPCQPTSSLHNTRSYAEFATYSSKCYHPANCQSTRAYQNKSRSPMDFQRSMNEFLQTSQKSTNGLIAIDKQFQAFELSNKATFQEMLESFADLAQNFCEALKEHLQEELVEDEELVEADLEKPQEETELLVVHEPPPKIEVQFPRTGTEITISPEKWKTTKSTVGDKKFDSHAPSLPLKLAAIPQLKPLDVSITPAPPPSRVSALPLVQPPPEPSDSRLPTRLPPPSPPPPKPPDPTPNVNPTPAPPPKPPDPSFWIAETTMPRPSCHQIRPFFPTAEPISNKSQPSDTLIFSTDRSQPSKNSTICVLPCDSPENSHIVQSDSATSPKPQCTPSFAAHSRDTTVNTYTFPVESLTNGHVRPEFALNVLVISNRSYQPHDLNNPSKSRSRPFRDSTICGNKFQATLVGHLSPRDLWTSPTTMFRLITATDSHVLPIYIFPTCLPMCVPLITQMLNAHTLPHMFLTPSNSNGLSQVPPIN